MEFLGWAAAALAAVAPTAGPQSAPAVQTTVLAVAGRANATPTIVADGSLVVVAWGATVPDGATDVFAAVSRDGATTFGEPVRVNHIGGDARLNGEQPPRVALVARPGGAPSITIVWTTGGASGTKLVSATSTDAGRTFGASRTVPHGDAQGNRGWQNVAAGADGRVYTVWLDHREMAHPAGGHRAAVEDAGGVRADSSIMAQQSKLYVGTLDGPVAPHPVTGGVCYCCKTAIAVGADGAIYTAWRHVYPGNLRDMAFSVSRDGARTFSAPVRVSADQWELDGCPDDGPAIAVDAASRVHIAWPTMVTDEKTGEPTIGIFYATSRDGRSFTPRTRMPTEGVAHHPQIVLGADRAPLVVWDESGSGPRHIVAAAVPPGLRMILGAGGPGVYPSIARASRGFVAVWTAPGPSGSVVRVERVALPASGR